MNRPKLVAAVSPFVVVALAVQTWSAEGVRRQLARQQEESGLTLATYSAGTISSVVFAKRSFSNDLLPEPFRFSPSEGVLSPDGTEIAFSHPVLHHLRIIQRDGSGLREYPEVAEVGSICWSEDESKLVVRAKDLLILDVGSKATEVIAEGPAYTTPQCWSPDGKEIVYQAQGTIRVYDLAQRKWHELTHGKSPTWSPDGDWIAFFEDDAFYVIRPSGKDRKLLFKKKNAFGALLWSPDSRIVAYLRHCCPWRAWLDCDIIEELRVRRLSDNSDERVIVSCGIGYDWSWVQPNRRKRIPVRRARGIHAQLSGTELDRTGGRAGTTRSPCPMKPCTTGGANQASDWYDWPIVGCG